MTTIDAVARMARRGLNRALMRSMQWWTLCLVGLLAAPAWAQTMTFPVQMRWITNTVFYGPNTTGKFLYDHSFLTPEEACASQGTLDPNAVGAVPDPLVWNNVDGAMVHPCIAHHETVNYSAGRTWQMPYCAARQTWSSTCEATCSVGTVWSIAAQACLISQGIPLASNPPAKSCPMAADPEHGNPIYPLRGVKREVVDTRLRLGHLSLQFTYDNTSTIPKLPAELVSGWSMAQRGGVLGGPLWFSNLHRRVSVVARTSATALVPTFIERGNGVAKTMTRTDDHLPLTAEPGNADRLIDRPGGGFIYYDSTGNLQETYDSDGRLTALMWADGTRISLGYSDGSAPVPGQMVVASDNLGHSLAFGYEAAGGAARLATVTDASGGVTTLGYDSQGNLASIGWSDGRTRSFVYDNTGLPWALTGVRDERSVRYATFGYDAEGRAIRTEHAGGVNRYSVSWATPPTIQITEEIQRDVSVRYANWSPPQDVVLAEPNGSSRSLTVASLNGKNVLSGQSQAAGAGCGASTSAQGYDANGNGASRDDFNGTRTCFANDLGRNLQTGKVSALNQSHDCAAVIVANATLPAGALKTSTLWHPDWSLPIKLAEPRRVTTYVYNGQPDPFASNALANCAPSTALLPDGKPIAVLCKQVVQQTTDADGHLGFSAGLQAGATVTTNTWTYNQDGQVLTATDADSGTTTYVYYTDTTSTHTRGDLQSITTSLGKVTSFNEFNKLGQVLRSTDDNGVVTVNTYDLRQRLLSSTVGADVTSYTWDAAGQLKQVMLPNGAWVGFDYDDAHRQVAVYDHKSNRIDYVLDNAGNRTSEKAKDPAGTLKRTLARVMDALGRAQQGTGRE